MSKIAVNFSCGTHIGYKYTQNEDSFGGFPEAGLWIVADGMGGHNCGKSASHFTVAGIYAELKSGHSLADAVQKTHQAILLAGSEDPEKRGMGSTVVALKFHGNFYEIAAVGDSRGYLFRDNQIQQITCDHTLVQELINQGEITQEQAKIHPDRNILKQALGSQNHPQVKVDIFSGEMQRGDIFLLCTDGLTNRVQDYKLENILKHAESLQQAVDNMIQSALAFGGRDNITVILVQFQ